MSYFEVLEEVHAPVIGVAPGHRDTYRAHLRERHEVHQIYSVYITIYVDEH